MHCELCGTKVKVVGESMTDIEEEKYCTKCNKLKPLTEYHYISQTNRHHSWCKECLNGRRRTRYNYLNKVKNGYYQRPDIKKKKRAHSYIHRGLVEKKPCIICGIDKTEAHHEDYDKPTDVVWFCHKHHMQYHNKKLNSNQLDAIISAMYGKEE